jgi:hypothetical protein
VAYWLDLFTIETWREFKQAGGQISGFRESRWVRVKKMQPGDRLLCYIVGLKRWVGVLKVVGDPWNGTEPAIWQSDTFPARVNVEIELELAPETGVPAVDLIPEMPMFDKLDGMRGWGAFFMDSPALWQDVDGDIVVKAIQSAIESPVSRPIPRSAMRKRPRTIETPDLGTVAIPEAEDDEESGQSLLEKTAPPEREHTEIQALLARMGRAMGHDVFIARNDRSQTWQSKPLSELPGVVDTLPTHFNEATDRVVELIDVLWLDDNAIAAAFEVERSTVIYSGLLRMSDLLVMQPNLDIPIFLVAPEDRRLHVQREVNRPSFKAMKTKKPLRQACRFISFESLRDAAERYRDVFPHLKASWFRSELSESCELDDA